LSQAPYLRRTDSDSRGYRFFVDTLLTVKQLDRVEISQLEVNLHHPDHPQRLIGAASQLLSELTHFAGVVVASKRKTPAFRHMEFSRAFGQAHSC